MANQKSLYEHLKEVARAGQTTTYTEIAPMLKLNMRLQTDRTEIGKILGDISKKEHSEGRPMLSVVVVKADTRSPSTGFFNLARELDLYHGNDDVAFFVKELKKVHEYWRTH